jgi:hypothetical protein
LSDNYFNGSNGYGIACYGSASPSAYYNSTYSIGGNNRVQYNGNRGIVITGSSAPDFGSPYGYNSIFSNTGYEIDNSTGSYIFARNNYWGNPNGPRGGDINGLVYYVPYLEDDPNPDRIVSGDYLALQKTNSEFPPMLEQAVLEMSNNNYEKATELLETFILHEKESSYGSMAGVLLLKNLDFYMDGRSRINEIENLLNNEVNKGAKFELLTGLSNAVLKTVDKNGALTFIEDLKDFELTTEQRNRILFQKAFTNIYGLNDLENGLVYLHEIVNRNSVNTLDYQLAMEEINYLNQIYDLMPKPGDEENNIESIEATTLAANYPNPFNPTTTITYTLKEKSNVNLTVYDILGRELEVLVNTTQDAGEYKAQFNASQYVRRIVPTSGVYIYRLKVGDKTFVKKMLLTK